MCGMFLSRRCFHRRYAGGSTVSIYMICKVPWDALHSSWEILSLACISLRLVDSLKILGSSTEWFCSNDCWFHNFLVCQFILTSWLVSSFTPEFSIIGLTHKHWLSFLKVSKTPYIIIFKIIQSFFCYEEILWILPATGARHNYRNKIFWGFVQ